MKRLLPILLATAFSAAVAAPTAPVVVNGTATFNQQGNVFTITNTPNTIINWQTFSIAPGEVTRFVQQSADSAVLNRILGQDPSQILGALQSNGQVFLINPNGVMFGQGARIDVAGLTASTLNMTDADFLAGRNRFSAGPVAGSVGNQGAITTPSGGHVFLIAPNVENTGIITSPKGDVVLAAGHQVQLVDSRDPDVHVVVSAPDDKAVNLGQVISHGGRVGIYGGLVSQRGVVNANSAVVGENGKIVLKASGDTLLEAGSTTTATGAGNGGSVHVLGNRVGMTGNASIDVSGATGGGTVLMGGDYRGGNPLYASAQQTVMGKDASIKADATLGGSGGKVILWALGATRAFGSISARGASGKGGFVETSADYLDVNGIRVDTRALDGATGLWLLDPNNIRVGLPAESEVLLNVIDAKAPFSFEELTNGYVSAATLMAANSDILLEAKNNIFFNQALSAGANDITARAGGSIHVDAPLTTTSGKILLSANDASAGMGNMNGGVYVNSAIQSGTGEITLAGAELAIASGGSLTTSAANINLTADAISIGDHVTAGSVAGSNLVTITPATVGRDIWISNTAPTYFAEGPLQLTNSDLGYLHASQVRIGHSERAGNITWALTGIFSSASARTWSLATPGTIDIDGWLELQDAAGHIGLHAGTVNVASGIDRLIAQNITLQANQLSVDGTVNGATKISVLPMAAGTPINVGGESADDGYTLGLNNDELSKLHTENLYVGAIDLEGGISVGHTSYANAGGGTLTLDAGTSGIHLYGALSTNGKLVLKAGESGIYQTYPETESDTSVITTPHLHIEGNGLAGVSAYLANGTNAIGILTGSNLGELSLVNGGNLTIGDGSTGISFGDVSNPDLRIASGGVVTVQNTIDARNGWIDIQADAVQVGLPLDDSNQSGGDSNAILKAGSVALETRSFSMSKGTGLLAEYITMETDKFALEQGALITTGSYGSVSITPYSYLAGIELGAGALDRAGSETATPTLGLSESELQAIDTHELRIGDYIEGEPGLVSVVGSLDLTTSPNLIFTNISLGSAGMHVLEGASLRATNELSIGSANSYSRAGPVIVDGILEAAKTAIDEHGNMANVGVVEIEAQSISGIGKIKGGFASLDAIDGIGTATVPLNTQVSGLWAQTAAVGAAAPLNIRNNIGASGPLNIHGLFQYGDGLGSIELENSGPLLVSNSGVDTVVQAQSGAISLVTDDALTVDGLVKTTTGDISLTSGATGDLTLTAAGRVQSDSGNISLYAGGSIMEPDGSVSTGAPGAITRHAGGATPPPPPPPPTLVECLANSNISGCSVVLSSALSACIADKTGPYCAQVLPSIDACIADENKAGCSVVLPTIGQCLDNRDLQGCSVVLPTTSECLAEPSRPGCVTSNPPPVPTLEACLADRSLPGCDTVLPNLAQCLAEPTAPGCDAVLPDIGVCVADRTVPGCEAVLPEIGECVVDKTAPGCEAVLPDITQCIADRTAPGCQVVLPDLDACVADENAPGCQVVLPDLGACIADKTAPGCQVVLPDMDACVADENAPGCQVVLPELGACIADKTAPGCQVVLPELDACVADKTAPGCQVVLPELNACIADKTAPGCQVVLPEITACVADKTAPGCQVVLPEITACVADKTAPGCEVVLPEMAACVADKTAPGCQVVLPEITVCVADKTAPGCEVVLPPVDVCVTDKTAPGCQVVLPPIEVCVADKTRPGCVVVLPPLVSCVADPTQPGCGVVLPPLTSCVADKTMPGCEVILPTLAECTSSPSLDGCGVVLPRLEQCAVNPNQAGCEAVLPRPDFCSIHPTDPRCVVFSPSQTGSEKKPVAQAVQTTVTLLNSGAQLGQSKQPSGTSGDAGQGGTTSGQGQSPGPQSGEKPEKPDDKEQGNAAPDTTGAKNEKPATKLYCN